MRNEFFVERYAHEKHQAHVREAAHDRLLATPPPPEQQGTGRVPRAQAAHMAAIAAMIAFARRHARRHVPWRAAQSPVQHGRAM
jgi:hypothetical protein